VDGEFRERQRTGTSYNEQKVAWLLAKPWICRLTSHLRSLGSDQQETYLAAQVTTMAACSGLTSLHRKWQRPKQGSPKKNVDIFIYLLNMDERTRFPKWRWEPPFGKNTTENNFRSSCWLEFNKYKPFGAGTLRFLRLGAVQQAWNYGIKHFRMLNPQIYNHQRIPLQFCCAHILPVDFKNPARTVAT
jgi:hypothetical protein